MANTLRIKRRASGGSGAPASLANAELAFNEVDNVLYYGKGTGGAGGTATTVEAIGGIGAFCALTGNQTIAGVKTFSSTIAGSVDGNAGTATTLQTARTIGGVSFNGSANINLPGVNTAGNQNTTGNAANVTGVVAVLNGGSGATTAQGAINTFAGAVTSGQYLRGNGTNVVMSAIQVSDVPTLNQNTTGNAATATILATARSIGGVSFNGSADINLPGVNTAGNQNTTGNAANVTGVVAIANGGSGTTTAQGAINTFAGAVTSGQYLRGNGTNVLMSGIQAADVPTLNQNTTGNAATATALATGRILSFTGDATGAFAAFNGTAALAAALTLATVNSNVGTFNRVTVNAKGLVTAAVDGTLNNIPTPTANYSLGGFKLTSVGTPTADTDAANKAYVDGVAQGLDVKASVVAATTGNITLSGAQTIDGISVVAGDRVLVRAQSAPATNGIYVAASGAWVRALDADVYNELISAFVFVERGTTLADTGWVCSVDAGGTLGTTAVTFTQFSGAGTYTAGAGLTLSGSQFLITNTAVTPASYGSAGNTLSITVNSRGQLTAASSQTIAITNAQVSGLGTMSTQAANNVNITGGSITGLSTFDNITIDGGTF